MTIEQQSPTTTTSAPLAPELRELLPFLPMMYVAWADGVLTPTEIDTIQSIIHQQPWLSPSAIRYVDRWTDPKRPPSLDMLQRWLGTIRTLAESLPESSKTSLARLGAEMAKAGTQMELDTETLQALDQIEETLGFEGCDICQEILAERQASDGPGQSVEEAKFDIDAMTCMLDGEYADVREPLRTLFRDPSFRYEYGLPKEEYRELVLRWCRELATRGVGALSFPEFAGGKDDLGRFVAAFETIAFHDLSLLVKFGVQFGLFGGSILFLGTEKHHRKYLKDVGSLDIPGCFAMTETGHGSNVQALETTARFDPATDEFLIHSPTPSARKDYIGNAAAHGILATVFAQLEVAGECHGVHAFLVPIRDEHGNPCPGVTILDCGEKMGLNGVDNGRLSFDNVRVPRENMLNALANVTQEGEYHSEISSMNRRFFMMLGTLIGGRVSVGSGALSAAKSSLAIAVRYALKRRQFGPVDQPEVLLMDFQTHQRRLMPLIAKAYALDAANKYLLKRFLERTEEDSRELEGLAAGLKAVNTWNATHTIQTARECCGGQGYLAENRFAALKADTDVFATFEGDNTVLMQLVSKSLLTEYKRSFSNMDFFGALKYVGKLADSVLAEWNPIYKRLTDEDHLMNFEFHQHAFRFREDDLLRSVASRLRKRLKDKKMDPFSAFLECQDHLMALAKAHVERVVIEQFQLTVEHCEDESLRSILRELCALHALTQLEEDMGWFMENGYIESSKARAIRKQVLTMCARLRGQAIHLVNAFGIPLECLGAPIAM